MSNKRYVKIPLNRVGSEILELGYQGENLHTTVVVSCTEVLGEYSVDSVAMVVKPPAGDLYLATIDVDGTDVVWEVADSDVVTSGAGQYQLIFTAGQEIIRSAVGSIRIRQSIEPTGAAPSPAETWSQAAADALADTQGALLNLVRSELPDVVDGVSEDMTNAANMMALFAQNMGEIEETAQTAADVSAETQALDEELQTALSEIDQILESSNLSRWSRLNRPNLLKQDYWVSRLMPTSEVIYDEHNITYADISQGNITYTIEDSRITTGHAVLQLQSRIYAIVRPENVTVTFAAGVATVTVANRERTEDEISTATQEVSTDIRLWLSTVENRKVPYGEGSRYYGSGTPYLNSFTNGQYPGDADGDSIGEIVVDLAAADQITEPDGEVYDTAIQYNVTANSAWGNADWMVFNYQGFETTWDASKTEPKDYGNIPEMIPGKKYTLSCWARMVSGEKAMVSFAYGGKYGNTPYSETTYADYNGIRSAPVEIASTEWQRISWTFVFEGMTGNQYTYTNGTRTDEATGDTINTITRTKNWTKRVQFGVHRKYTGTLQLCGFRLVAGNLEINTRYDELKEMILALEERVAALEGGN